MNRIRRRAVMLVVHTQLKVWGYQAPETAPCQSLAAGRPRRVHPTACCLFVTGCWRS
jgi:hypothetical protein